MIFSIIIFIAILSFLVIIHEFGHFITAKKSGIGVEEFGFGLPPRIWGKKIGETLYSLNWLPFGGFVRLVGEDTTDKKAKNDNSYYVKTLKQRMLVVVAGVLMNFVVAVLLFYVILFALGFKVSLPSIVDHKFRFVNQTTQVLVADVSADSIAQKAGLKPGDSIISANGENLETIDELQRIIRANENREVGLEIENPVNNQIRKVSVVPAQNADLKAPAIGVVLGDLIVLKYETPAQKVFSGFGHSYNTATYSFKVLGEIIGYSFAEKDITPVSENVAGPVGIAAITDQAVKLGPLSVLQLMALLSLNLAIMNILPIPALDGGKFFFLVVEAVTRKKIYPNVEKWVHTIGFAFLIGLIVLITFNDIAKILK